MRMIAGLLTAVTLMLGLPAVAEEPVDFSLPDLDGQPRTLSEFRGKWVVINYWATWCPPCLEEIPDLVDFHERHHDRDAVVIGINYEDIPAPQLRAFSEEYFINYPILQAEDMRPAHERLSVGGLPTTYIISPEGEPVARQIGGVTDEVLEDYIKQKQAERASARLETR